MDNEKLGSRRGMERGKKESGQAVPEICERSEGQTYTPIAEISTPTGRGKVTARLVTLSLASFQSR